jgi:hypothetical protein
MFIVLHPAFACKSEGFFPHPSSCKKYYWCLDAGALGKFYYSWGILGVVTCVKATFGESRV